MERSLSTYRKRIKVNSSSTQTVFMIAYRSFTDLEKFIDGRPGKDQVYDYLQQWINRMKEDKKDPSTIKTYFIMIRKYMRYRGVEMHPLDTKRNLDFPTKREEELHPLEIATFQQILEWCSYKRRMLYLAQSSSGMRIGEIIRLRKNDIHTGMERLMVRIHAAFTKKKQVRTTFFSTEAAGLIVPRLKEIGGPDLVFGTHQDARIGAAGEAAYLRRLLKKMGINDKYGTNGRNVVTTRSFRTFFITQVSGHDPNLAKYFAGQKGYPLQYDRLTDEEKLDEYLKFEPSLLMNDRARNMENIRRLEKEDRDARRCIEREEAEMRRRVGVLEEKMREILSRLRDEEQHGGRPVDDEKKP